MGEGKNQYQLNVYKIDPFHKIVYKKTRKVHCSFLVDIIYGTYVKNNTFTLYLNFFVLVPNFF